MPNINVKEEAVTEQPENTENPVQLEEPNVAELAPQEAITPQRVHRGVPKVFVLIAGLILIGLVAGLVVLINDRNQLKQEVTNLSKTQVAQNSEAEELTAEVGKLIELPKDETPTVATVVDAAKVKNQAFFANAQNGDKVLLFAKAGKAVLYRPSTKKIVEVAPINIGANQTPSGTSTNPTTNKR